jgi:hypothetical protein
MDFEQFTLTRIKDEYFFARRFQHIIMTALFCEKQFCQKMNQTGNHWKTEELNFKGYFYKKLQKGHFCGFSYEMNEFK